MNLIILYIISFFATIAVLATGYFINMNARNCFEKLKGFENIKGINAKDFSYIFFRHNKLKNIELLTLRAKKTNYYSPKYNVIKISPEIVTSTFLFDIAICAKCANQAKKQQCYYISATLRLIVSMLCNIISVLFVPTILICAILNISLGLERVALTISLIDIICYLLAFLTQIIFYLIDKSSTKHIVSDIQKLNLFEESELKTLASLIETLNKFDFFSYTRLSIKIFSYLNPATFIDKNENN